MATSNTYPQSQGAVSVTPKTSYEMPQVKPGPWRCEAAELACTRWPASLLPMSICALCPGPCPRLWVLMYLLISACLPNSSALALPVT